MIAMIRIIPLCIHLTLNLSIVAVRVVFSDETAGYFKRGKQPNRGKMCLLLRGFSKMQVAILLAFRLRRKWGGVVKLLNLLLSISEVRPSPLASSTVLSQMIFLSLLKVLSIDLAVADFSIVKVSLMSCAL